MDGRGSCSEYSNDRITDYVLKTVVFQTKVFKIALVVVLTLTLIPDLSHTAEMPRYIDYRPLFKAKEGSSNG